MTFHVKVHVGTRTREHVLELSAGSGLTRLRHAVLQLRHDGQPLEVDCARISPGVFSILIRGHAYQVHVVRLMEELAGRPEAWAVTLGRTRARVEVHDQRFRSAARRGRTPSGEEDAQEIRAPMPGKVLKVLVREKQEVSLGQGLLVIEAMKMQNELRAPRAGRVEKVYAQEGTGVESGALLLRVV